MPTVLETLKCNVCKESERTERYYEVEIYVYKVYKDLPFDKEDWKTGPYLILKEQKERISKRLKEGT
jgi:hypothetical protein